MKVTLLNFGLSARVIPNLEGGNEKLEIGSIATVDIHPVYIDMLTKAQERADETLFIVAEDYEVPPDLKRVADLLNEIDMQSYDHILAGVVKILGADIDRMRPDRGEMRRLLKQAALNFIKAGIPIPDASKQPQSTPEKNPPGRVKGPGRINIQEEQRPDTPKQPRPTSEPPARAAVEGEMSEALRLALGEDAPPRPSKRVKAPAPAKPPKRVRANA